MKVKVKIDQDFLRRMLEEKMSEKMQRLAEILVAIIVEEGLRQDLWVYGNLLRSWKIVDAGRLKKIIGFYAPYVLTIEYGGEPRSVPIVRLIDWLIRKFGYDYRTAERDAYRLQRWIREHGTQPHPFVRVGIERFRRLLSGGR